MSKSPPPPLTDQELLDYSLEHLTYEWDMLRWAFVAMQAVGDGSPAFRFWLESPSQKLYLDNGLLECFAIHARNLIDFLYPGRPLPTDVVASHFFDHSEDWPPGTPVPPSLARARTMAHKQVAHLTRGRIRDTTHPDKRWEFEAIVAALTDALRRFAAGASPSRLHAVFVQRVNS